MPDALSNAAAALFRTLAGVTGRTVTFVRGNASASVTAVVGSSTFEQPTADGLTMREETRDYLVVASALVLGGVAVQPKPGDRFVEGDPSTGAAYEVVSVAGVGPWRWSDPNRNAYRIHTKGIGNLPKP